MSDVFFDTPMTVAGVGGGTPTRWLYSDFGKFMNAYNIRSGVDVTFNLQSVDDIKAKLDSLVTMRDRGVLNPDDLNELEERVRTFSNLVRGGVGKQTQAGIQESRVQEGSGSSEWLQTDEVKEKRKKALEERKTDKALGILDESKKKKRKTVSK